jgi:rRNA maturation endonuclease Nob1
VNRLHEIQNLLSQYELNLGDIITVKNTFEVDRLPETIQKFIELSKAQNSKFSNISTLTTINYCIAHVCTQLRIKINDIVYSKDILGVNAYFIHLSGSGFRKA